MLNDQINSTPDGHGLAKGAFYLLINAKVLKNVRLAPVKFDNIKLFGCDLPNIGPYFFIKVGVVDMHAVERFTENIT